MRDNWTVQRWFDVTRNGFPAFVWLLSRALLIAGTLLWGPMTAIAAAGESQHSDLATILKTGLPQLGANQFLRALRSGPGASFRQGQAGNAWQSLQLKEDKTETTPRA